MPKYFMPVGNTDFKEIRETGLYYIDKTMLIEQLVNQSKAKVTLFTRPRRFGKSLNMSMLQHFFDIREDSKGLFEGLRIAEYQELCKEWLNGYPTIFVSFKDVGGTDFETTIGLLKSLISKLYEKHEYLIKDNEKLTKRQQKMFNIFLMGEADKVDLTDSLYLLSDIMCQYYNKPVILLIDEYDVPMAKGDSNGYYREITDIMRHMFGKVLKDNPYVKFAILTGCLRIAEESIFTGLNNLVIKSISDMEYEECFGFTKKEMLMLLTDTELMQQQDIFKEWYDGYIFGSTEVYCPWDVLNYVDALQKNPNQPPMNYWANTSDNDIVKRFLKSEFDVSEDFEILLGGGVVEKIINPNVTYGDLLKSETNLWSVLYMTGYVTILPETQSEARLAEPDQVRGMYELSFKLRLPNKEIRMLFAQIIATWFEEKVLAEDRTELFEAIWNGQEDKLSEIISDYLYKTISYFDYHENYYHAFLTGLLSGNRNIIVKSNQETGKGRADIIVKNKEKYSVAIFELKRARKEDEMEILCKEALRQMEEKKYYVPFKKEKVIKYAIVFCGKECMVKIS